MTGFPEFNPLDYEALAESIGRRLESIDAFPLSRIPDARGSGVYAIWYDGTEKMYEMIVGTDVPIYVGRAEPKGGRTGRIWRKDPSSKELRDRLHEHADSINSVESLDIRDFRARGLVVPAPFIRAAESLMIDLYGPPWNVALTGFGKHAPGSGRDKGMQSWWDTVHPGRDYDERPDPKKTLGAARRRIETGLKAAREKRRPRL